MEILPAIYLELGRLVSPNFCLSGGQGWNRTTDTRIFSPLLYQLSYLAMTWPQIFLSAKNRGAKNSQTHYLDPKGLALGRVLDRGIPFQSRNYLQGVAMPEDHTRRPHMDAPVRRIRTAIDIADIVVTTRVHAGRAIFQAA